MIWIVDQLIHVLSLNIPEFMEQVYPILPYAILDV